MRKIVLLIGFFLMTSVASYSQCAMCRAQLENNVSNGDVGIAAGINTGILYLLSMPYLIILVLGFFWYKSSRKNASNQFSNGLTSR